LVEIYFTGNGAYAVAGPVYLRLYLREGFAGTTAEAYGVGYRSYLPSVASLLTSAPRALPLPL